MLARYTQRQDVPIKNVWVNIGKQDDPHFIQQAKKMKSELQRLGYNPWRGDKLDIAVRSGGHDSGYWSQRLPEYIEWYNRCFHPVP